MTLNGTKTKINGCAKSIDGIYYLPFSEMEDVYNVRVDKLENRIHIEQQAVKMMESVKAVENRWDVAEKENDLATEQQKEKILQLYKQGMSILEISKELKIGQGEVKLIIGLYTT